MLRDSRKQQARVAQFEGATIDLCQRRGRRVQDEHEVAIS